MKITCGPPQEIHDAGIHYCACPEMTDLFAYDRIVL